MKQSRTVQLSSTLPLGDSEETSEARKQVACAKSSGEVVKSGDTPPLDALLKPAMVNRDASQVGESALAPGAQCNSAQPEHHKDPSSLPPPPDRRRTPVYGVPAAAASEAESDPPSGPMGADMVARIHSDLPPPPPGREFDGGGSHSPNSSAPNSSAPNSNALNPDAPTSNTPTLHRAYEPARTGAEVISRSNSLVGLLVPDGFAIEVDRVAPGTATERASLVAFQVTTRHRVYGVNAEMLCVSVRELDEHVTKTANEFIGARLVGDHLRRPDGTEEAVFPLPVPNSEAMFELRTARGVRMLRTSKVKQVSVQLSAIRVSPPPHP